MEKNIRHELPTGGYVHAIRGLCTDAIARRCDSCNNVHGCRSVSDSQFRYEECIECVCQSMELLHAKKY